MRKFKVGDRVLCATGYEAPCGPFAGWTGTVREVCQSEDVCVVTWDGKGKRPHHEDTCDFDNMEKIAPDLEARVAALEKLVGVTKAPEYSFGDRVEVLYEGEWVEGLIAAPRDDENGTRWCSFLDPKTSDGGYSWWFGPHEIRPRQ